MSTHTLLNTAAIVGLLAAVGPLAAQAPVVTSKGDPSVRADSIYKLAIDKPEYSEQATLLLLDDGIIRVEADGRTTRTYHQIVEILRESAIRGYQERSLAWVPGRQVLRVNWVKVVKPDGTVISDSASQVQDADVPAAMSDPIYLDQRVRRLSVSGVAVGTLFDMSWTVEDTVAFPPNDYMGLWNVSMGSPVRRSRLIVDLPASVTPRIVEDNLDFKRVERTANGRHVYVWARQDVPRIKPELMAADSNGVFMRVFFALPRTWSDVGHWYAKLSADRYELGPVARERIAKLVAGARTRDDSVRALHKFVAQDIRYVSIALGRGGYQPRTPDEVVRTGFGDCKDKTTLFVAALNSWNIPTAVALLRTDKADRRVPSISQFNPAIAAIEQPNGGYHYVDLTASITPFDELPRPLQGDFAIVVRQDGRVDEVTLPIAPMSDNLERMRTTGDLSADGEFDGHVEQTGTGLGQYMLRAVFATPLDSTQRVQFARAFANRVSSGMSGDSLVSFDGKDFRATPRLWLHVHGARAAQRSGSTMILSLGLSPMTGMATLADRLDEQAPRRFPIDASRIFGDMTRETEVRIHLPEGWRAQLPRAVHTKSVFGEYDSDYAQEGRDLVMRRRMLGARGVYAPDHLAELTSWLRDTAKDDAKFIILTAP